MGSEKSAQVLALVVSLPSDVADPPTAGGPDKVEHKAIRCPCIDKFDGGARFAGGLVAYVDVECSDVPILRIDERVKIERAHFLASRSVPAVFDDQGRERGFEIAPDRSLVGERAAFGVLSSIGSIDAADEIAGRAIGRPGARTDQGPGCAANDLSPAQQSKSPQRSYGTQWQCGVPS